MNYSRKFLITSTMVVALATVGTSPVFAQSKPATKPGHWLALDSKPKTVDLLLIGGYAGASAGMNFDGYSKGQMKVTVPTGWKVNVAFENASSNMPHSAMIVPSSTKGKVMGFSAAFPGANSPNPTTGLKGKATQNFSFVAKKAGTYLIWCGLPGHGIAGMYDTFVVDAHAKAPSISVGGKTTTL